MLAAAVGQQCKPAGVVPPCHKGACTLAGDCSVVVAPGQTCAYSAKQTGVCTVTTACVLPAGEKCGPPVSQCVAMETDGYGGCTPTVAFALPCAPTGTICTIGLCNAAAECVTVGPKKIGSPCDTTYKGKPIAGQCDNMGTCLPPAGAPCGDPPCTIGHFSGSGTCIIDKVLPAGTSCLKDGNLCTSGLCTNSGTCAISNATQGMPCALTTTTDGCTVGQCNGKGGCAAVLAPGNLCDPKLGACWSGVCDAAGICQGKPKAAMTFCGTTADACMVGLCDGGGTCKEQIAVGKMLADGNTPCTFVGCDEDGGPITLANAPTLAVPVAFAVPNSCSAVMCIGKAGAVGANTATVITAGKPKFGAGVCRVDGICTATGGIVDDPQALPRPSGTPCASDCALGYGTCDGMGTCVPVTPFTGTCGVDDACHKASTCDGKGNCPNSIKVGASCPLALWQAAACMVGTCSSLGICVPVPQPAGSSCTSADPIVKAAACTSSGQCMPTAYNVGMACPDSTFCTGGTIAADGQCVYAYPPAGAVVPLADPTLANIASPFPCGQYVCDGAGGIALAVVATAVGAVCGVTAQMCTAMRCQADGKCGPQAEVGAACPVAMLCAKGVCDSKAACQPAADPTATCPSAGPCWSGSCLALGVCAQEPKGSDNPCVKDGAAGQCDGMGHCVTAKTFPGALCAAGKGCALAAQGNLDANLNCTAAVADGAVCKVGCVSSGHCFGGSCIGFAVDSVCQGKAACSVGASCDATPTDANFGACSAPSGLPTGAVCDDANECTADFCYAETGCSHANLTGIACLGGNGVCNGAICKLVP